MTSCPTCARDPAEVRAAAPRAPAATAHGPVREAVVDEGRPTAGSVLRRFTLGSGPLKRTSDRIQFLARVLLVCSWPTAVPVALVVAVDDPRPGVAEGAAQAQAGTRSTAASSRTRRCSPRRRRLPADRPARPPCGPGRWARSTPGSSSSRAGARTGSTVLVWVDRAGGLDHPAAGRRGRRGPSRRRWRGDVPAACRRSRSWPTWPSGRRWTAAGCAGGRPSGRSSSPSGGAGCPEMPRPWTDRLRRAAGRRERIGTASSAPPG